MGTRIVIYYWKFQNHSSEPSLKACSWSHEPSQGGFVRKGLEVKLTAQAGQEQMGS